MTPARRAELDHAMRKANEGRLKKGETRQQKIDRVIQELYEKWSKEDAE